MGSQLEVMNVRNRGEARQIGGTRGNSQMSRKNRPSGLSEEDYRRQRRKAAARRKRERQLKVRRIYCGMVTGILGIVLVVTSVGIVKTIQAKSITKIFPIKEYEKITQDYLPNKPKSMEETEMLQALKELALEYPEFQIFYEEQEQYPEKLLMALCNNPEMYEFVKGYPEADRSEAGEITKQEKEEEYPLFLQWDKRWGYVPYGDSMIGLAGCGPTCLSMVIVALTGDESATPAQIASYSMENGYYVEGTGTAWSLMTDGARKFGVKASEISLSEQVMKNCLDQGRPIICSVGPGDFTASGHFIVICGYDEDGFRVNDPNCIARSNESWTFEKLSGQIRILWAYSKQS